MEIINNLPTINVPNSPLNGKLEQKFWRYYLPPFAKPVFYNPSDPYDDLITIIWGPRGGGKTTTGVALSIIDGQMRGIPTISNIPICWIAKDAYGKRYQVESLPFDVDLFEHGDSSLKYTRLLLDEGNYLADRLRSNSNNNMGIVDILQQARKLRMCVTFCTINWQWIDPRVTGSLCDIVIECHDLYRKPYGKKHGLKKGERITWDIMDLSGKLSGRQFNPICSTTFNSRLFWNTFDTEHFVDPRAARRKRAGYNAVDKLLLVGPNGEPMAEPEWEMSLKARLEALGQTQAEWPSKDLYDTLGIDGFALRRKAGTIIRKFGIGVKDGRHGAIFNLAPQPVGV